jgi:hypothetical protein
LPDAWEIRHFGDINSSDASSDPDADSLNNLRELAYGTNPLDSDTDRDGVADAVEFSEGTLPLVVTATDLQTALSPDGDIGSLRVREVTAAMIRLEVHLQPKTPVELLHSTDFIQWTPLDVSFNGADQIQEIILPRSAGKPQGFYKLRMR